MNTVFIGPDAGKVTLLLFTQIAFKSRHAA